MAILRERKVWRREKVVRRLRVLNPERHLTEDEANNVRAALFKARIRFPTWAALERELGVRTGRVAGALRGKRTISADLAIRVARVAVVSVDSVLAGDYAKLSRCIRCGEPIVPPLKGRHLVRGARWRKKTGPCSACLLGTPEAPIEIRQISAEQCQNVIAALWVVREQFSTWEEFVEAIELDTVTVTAVSMDEMPPPLVLVNRLARLAGTTVESLAVGRFARMVRCLLCQQLSPPAGEGQRRWAASLDWRNPGVCQLCLRLRPGSPWN